MNKLNFVSKGFNKGCQGLHCPKKKHCHRFKHNEEYKEIMFEVPYKLNINGATCMYFKA